jgi:hypothetical protein
VWQEASQRAAAILGITASPLLSAAAVAQWAEDVRAKTTQRRQAVDQLCAALHQRLAALSIEAHSAPRLQTAQAALALFRGIAGTNDDDVASVIASATIATSPAAMGQCVERAADLVTVLERTSWELFEAIGQLSGERGAEAGAIVEQVKEALRRDEHVVPLGETLRTAQSAAVALLTRTVEAAPHQRSDDGPAPPPPSPPKPTTSRRGLSIEAATKVFDTLRQEMTSDTELVLDLEWRLYRRGDQAP